ncbi:MULTISPECIES: P-loop NTPase fold protein [unclassified Mesorhizobium]|uniref:KAP family P-loop NTPase fold protein n=1 Tax=unclassified Mesorhizobium TaxID=325217 RepID=UPI00163D75F3|nr:MULTISPECIES: P-loop NTPase fold protein [unclassified Mesorhizobium]
MAGIWDGDFLHRKDDAEFLIDYLLRRNKFAVDVGDRGTSINVTAPWGAGKTFFVNRMAEQLRANGLKVALVDAWRDDHAEDPIFAVMSAVLKALGQTGKKASLKRALKKNAGKIAIRAGKGLISRGAAFVIGQSAVEGIAEEVVKSVTDAGLESANDYAERALRMFDEGQEAIDDFRRRLAEGIKGQPPLFVIVDELDRCRPTYAVALLERIKHLFDVPNVVFIAATHSDQLAETIKAVYGQGFDAERYLLRFFDRTYSFDEPILDQFVAARWVSLGFDSNRVMEFGGVSRTDSIAGMAAGLGLSLRDIDQCLGVLWSIIELSDNRIEFPMLLAFPAIAAYQQRRMSIFEFLTRDWESPTPDGYQGFISKRPIYALDQTNKFGNRTGNKETASTYDFAGFLRRIVHYGVANRIDESSLAGQYAETFRQKDFIVTHSNTYRSGEAHSSLRNLNVMIRKAGRLSA